MLAPRGLIELRNVSKTYGQGEAEVRALDRIALRIGEGEFVAVMGPSGS
ncbi:MAG: macrolide ABC transporter ATP-binding protein, partial [Methyloceanibacter sp.]